MEDDEGLRPRAVLVGIGGDRGRVQDERIRLHPLELVLGRIDEERLREERVPGALRHDPHGDPVRRVRSRERVHDVYVVLAEPRRDLLAQPVEVLLGDRRVHLAPRDPVLRARLPHEELVLRGTTGVHARVHHERAPFGDLPVAALERVHVELGDGRVPVHLACRLDAVPRQRAPARNGGDHESVLIVVCPRNPESA